VGYDLASSQAAVELAKQFPEVYAVVGVHPHDARTVDEETYNQLRQLSRQPKVVAIGESGLDYYRDLSPRAVQQEVFRRHLRLAREVGLPVVVHDRDAHAEVLQIMREEQVQEVGGVLHCYSGSWEMVRECVELNCAVSLAGPVTYHNARRPQEVARKVSLDWLMVETDAPYLTPEPLRGRRNEPAHVRLVAQKIADLRGITLEAVAAATTAVTERIFRLPRLTKKI